MEMKSLDKQLHLFSSNEKSNLFIEIQKIIGKFVENDIHRMEFQEMSPYYQLLWANIAIALN